MHNLGNERKRTQPKSTAAQDEYIITFSSLATKADDSPQHHKEIETPMEFDAILHHSCIVGISQILRQLDKVRVFELEAVTGDD